MKRNLRAFVLIDGRNRVVPGSMVLREKMPGSRSNGTWLEIQAYACCAPAGSPGGLPLPQTIALPTLDVGNPNYHIQFTGNGGLTTGDVDTGTTTPAALQTYLVTNYATLGTYGISGTNLIFNPNFEGTTLAITAGA